MSKPERVQCTHCAGTGMCQKAIVVWVPKPIQNPRHTERANSMKVLQCSSCGTGVGRVGIFSSAMPPTCTVCGGRGWHAYDPALPPVVYR